MSSLVMFTASSCPVWLLGYPGRRCLCRLESCTGCTGLLAVQSCWGVLGAALKLGGAAVGAPEQQHPGWGGRSLIAMETDETVERWLPWKPVWESVGPSCQPGPWIVGMVLVHAAGDGLGQADAAEQG